MNKDRHFPNDQIQSVISQVTAALSKAEDQDTRNALQSSLIILDSIVDEPPSPRPFVEHIDYTIEDEECKPNGRELDVRVFYTWDDYDGTNELPTRWGASIEDIEVVAVRYFDRDGGQTTLREHHAALAWDLIDDEVVREQCTRDGYQRGIGKAPSTYCPGSLSITPQPETSSKAEFRMAPSVSTRESQAKSRKHG